MIHPPVKAKTRLFLFAGSITLLLLVSCGTKNKEAGKPQEIQNVNYAVAENRTFSDETEYSGTFLPNKEANLGSSMPGKVEKFYYSEGSFVTKGSLLVELSAELLTQALIEYEAIKKDYDRVSRLREKGSISEIDYDHLKAKLEASEVKTQMLKNNTSVIAPFDGIIVDYLVEEGENYFFNINLDPGYSNTSGILRLMQINPIVAEIQVNERDLIGIKKGQSVSVVCDALGSKEYKGTVRYIKPILSTTTRTAPVEIELNNSSGDLKPGMFARVVFSKHEISAVFIPVDAIYRQPGTPEDFVFVVTGGVVTRKPVKRLKTIDKWIAVDGIASGDTVVTQGKNKVKSGDRVNLKSN
ncbi:MAG TPA: efflux RND transporter periplasmic adaptor subunit [Bacteroidales bacterium]|nr:efflux RND transporter periplasmic adaptor subunit [Bacteroidales bacterium]